MPPKPYVPRGRPAGRPKAVIDWKVVDNCLIRGMSGFQTAAQIGVDAETLYRACIREYKIDFSDYARVRYAKGEAHLHAKQFDEAMTGNTRLLLHLGEHRLGQGKQQDLLAPNQTNLDTNHALMLALAKIAELEERINADKPKAE